MFGLFTRLKDALAGLCEQVEGLRDDFTQARARLRGEEPAALPAPEEEPTTKRRKAS